MLDMDQQLGEPAFDRFQLIDPRVGGVKLLDQLGDAVLQMTEHGVIAARELHPLDVVGQCSDDRFELAWHVLAAVVAGRERIGKRANALLQRVEDPVVVRLRRTVDLAGERAHFVGEARQSVVGSDLGDAAAQSRDRAFQLPQCCRILAVVGERIDLPRQRMQLVVDPGEIGGGDKAVEGIPHFGKSVLDACERRAVGSGTAARIDALGQLAHLAFERLHRFPRHGVLQHDADLGEVVAQRVDRLIHAAGLEALDLNVDLAQLLLKPGELLRACPRQALGR